MAPRRTSVGCVVLLKPLFYPTTEKGNSEKLNFRFHDFCELRRDGVLRSSGYSTPPVLSPDGPPTLGSGHGAQPSLIRCPSALGALPRVPYCPSRSGPPRAPRPKPRSPDPPPPS